MSFDIPRLSSGELGSNQMMAVRNWALRRRSASSASSEPSDPSSFETCCRASRRLSLVDRWEAEESDDAEDAEPEIDDTPVAAVSF